MCCEYFLETYLENFVTMESKRMCVFFFFPHSFPSPFSTPYVPQKALICPFIHSFIHSLSIHSLIHPSIHPLISEWLFKSIWIWDTRPHDRQWGYKEEIQNNFSFKGREKESSKPKLVKVMHVLWQKFLQMSHLWSRGLHELSSFWSERKRQVGVAEETEQQGCGEMEQRDLLSWNKDAVAPWCIYRMSPGPQWLGRRMPRLRVAQGAPWSSAWIYPGSQWRDFTED